MAMELMAPLMFAGLAVFLLLGYPVAFALAANGLLFAFIGIELGMLQPALLQALPQRLFGIMANQVLLAIPFFTFMGLVLERSGMAEDLLDTIGQLFGTLRGGLAYAGIFVGALLAATTGVVAVGHRNGIDLAAGHAALRLFAPRSIRRDLRLRHTRADYSAVARAHRTGGRVRRIRRRHVCRSAPTGAAAGRAADAVRPGRVDRTAGRRSGVTSGGARGAVPRFIGTRWSSWCRRCCSSFWCSAPSSWGSQHRPRAAPWGRWELWSSLWFRKG
jgi:uncharacterized membrane protein (UPF0136 family)